MCPEALFRFTECALVSMAMPLRCYAYTKNNNNSNTVCKTDVVLQHDYVAVTQFYISSYEAWQKYRKLECAILFRPAISTGFKAQRGAYTSSILSLSFFPLDLHFATTQACFCKDIKHVFYKNLWHVYVLRHKTTWKIYAKSDLTRQTKTDFQECNRNPNHMNVALNRFSKTDLM